MSDGLACAPAPTGRIATAKKRVMQGRRIDGRVGVLEVWRRNSVMIKGDCGVLEGEGTSPMNHGTLCIEESQKTAKFLSAAF